jgi:hypothetical protein
MATLLDSNFGYWQDGPGAGDGAGFWVENYWQVPNFQYWQHLRRRRVVVGGRPGAPVRELPTEPIELWPELPEVDRFDEIDEDDEELLTFLW